ncbi:MAG: rhodanese-like domain-containing protein [Planctomycetota bacterium]
MTAGPLDERGLPGNYPLQPEWEVTPRAVRDALAGPADHRPVLLDVREPDEVATAAIVGALHVPMGEVKARLQELTEHDDRPVVVFCHFGGRSMQVTAFLREQGFEDVKSMAGGVDLWAVDIDPSIARY